MTSNYIDHRDIVTAYEQVKSHIENTRLIRSITLSEMTGCNTLFKLENLQMTGSFKERGAVNKLLSLSETERSRGIIAASAGNHAQALAYHASRLGIDVKIVMPKYSPIVKVKSTEYWGAKVILIGETFDDALAHSLELVDRESRVYVHPFDDPFIAAGQGTIGIELLEHPFGAEIDAVLVPVGGGGLISGIATYLRKAAPHISIIGVEEENCDGMHQALQIGIPTKVPANPLIADGIAVREVAANNLKICNDLVDEIVTVSSDEIANAIMLMLEIEKLVVEGAAAAPLAALINNRLPQLKGKTVVSIVSGGNIDVNLLSRIIDQGLAFDGRVAKLETMVQDRPGHLETLLTVFREQGANVLEITHHRLSPRAPIGQVGVSVTLETRDGEHLAKIKSVLEARSYHLL
jgi:threonine dehydratase